MRGYKAPLYLMPGEIRGSGSPSISQCSTPSPCWGGGRWRHSLCKGHRQKWGGFLFVWAPASVFFRDSEGESKQGDFQMVFAGLPLCFPLEGEAATILNLGLEEPGKRNWRGGWLM